ncbi:hypothetical protein AS144_02140 [Francisella endosymbiont of Amblyomma maculatum]|nr:hypothetical protein AS144_02140 [Francisella endosymbiont of Amblyomma maculatum]
MLLKTLKQNNFNMGLEELESGKGYKEKLIKSFENLDLEEKIDETIDISIDFCLQQLQDPVFMDTEFKYWKLIKRNRTLSKRL